MRGGLLMTLHPFGPDLQPLLPQDDVELCRDVNMTIKCFKAGTYVIDQKEK